MEMKNSFEEIKKKNPEQQQFYHLSLEIFKNIHEFLENNEKYKEARIWERLLEPDRVITFRINWLNDAGEVQINRGYRVQMNNAIGPYKGGLRFHPSVNLDTFKSLALEQTLKNALTTLPLGAAKGGADFDPKGKSDQEVMRFCQTFMSELYAYIGPNRDIPAGDMGVSTREIGYLFGAYKKISRQFEGALTGKDLQWGGSLIRPEATGYGLIYFSQCMLEHQGDSLEGKRCLVSGAGNVSLHAADMLLKQKAKVVALSDSRGFIQSEEGLKSKQLEKITHFKRIERGSLGDFANEDRNVSYHAHTDKSKSFWEIPAELAFPCATQNEVGTPEAQQLLDNQIILLAEGANMPLESEAATMIRNSKILYAPGKAANAGGVAVSGLEMSQNRMQLSWSQDEVNHRLKNIMKRIHDRSLDAAKRYGREGDYVAGADIAGFEKVAEAMLAQGVV